MQKAVTHRQKFKDHLGSIRTTVDESGAVAGYDDYYPYGLPMPGRSSNTGNPYDNYKFTGYEVDDDLGLNLYNANARLYDPIIGRFMQTDPLAADYPGWCPYNYVMGNPLSLIDPTGMAPWDYYYDALGNYLGEDELETDNIWVSSKENYLDNVGKGGKAIQQNSIHIIDAKLSLEGWSNLFTDVYERAGYNINNLMGGKVQVANWINVQDSMMDSAREVFISYTDHAYLRGGGIITTWMDNKSQLAIFTFQPYNLQLPASYLNTMNNLQSLFHHEFQHYYDMREILGYARSLGNEGEIRAYKRQMSNSRYLNTTPRFQREMLKNCHSYGGCK